MRGHSKVCRNTKVNESSPSPSQVKSALSSPSSYLRFTTQTISYKMFARIATLVTVALVAIGPALADHLITFKNNCGQNVTPTLTSPFN
jgi:hypothetical protein